MPCRQRCSNAANFVRLLATCGIVTLATLLLAAASSTGTPAAAAADQLLWNGDFEGDLLSQFTDAPWNFVGAAAPALVTSPVDQGSRSARYVLPPGVSRNELVPRGPANSLSNGQIRYFRWSVFLPSTFAFNPRWRVIAQWKNDGTGSPPLEMALHGDRWSLEGGWNHGDNADSSDHRKAWTGTAERGRWTRFVVGIKFQERNSAGPNQGWVELWKDGVQVLQRLPFKTLYAGRKSYLKIGLYRDRGIMTTDTVYHDSWVMGTTSASVAR